MTALFRSRSITAWIALGGLVALLLAQSQLEHQRMSLIIGAGLLMGLAAWAWCADHAPPPPDRLGSLAAPVNNTLWLQLGLVGLAFAAALIGWTSLSGNAFNATAVVGWLGAVILWLAAWWPWQRAPRPLDAAERRRRMIAAAALLAITAFGAWLRFHRLAETPNDMTQDHGWKLLDIQTILDGGRPLFFPNNTGREPGQFYYIAMLIKLFDLPADFMALKIGNSIIGALTIPAIYLFAREVGGRKLGLFAAALYAIGKWPLVTTRMGLRYPYATLPAALILWALWRYARRGERRDALLVGVFMGIGLYGYIGIRVVPLAIIVVMGLLFFDRRRRSWQAARTIVGHGLLVAVTSALIFLPLGHFMLEFPDQFWYRVATRTTDAERSIEKDICQKDAGAGATVDPTLCKIGIFAYNNGRALAAFNWKGDRNEVNTVSYDPFLDLVTAALLLASLPVLIVRLFIQRSLRWWAFLLCIPIMLLATTLSIAFPIENPSTARTGVAMPLIFTLAAVPLALLAQWMLPSTSSGSADVSFDQLRQRRTRQMGRMAFTGAVLLALLAGATQQNYVRYFRDLDRQYRAFIPNTGEIAAAIESYAPRGIDRDHAYVLVWPYWFEGRNLSVHLGDIHWHERHEIGAKAALPDMRDGKPLLFILHKEDMKGERRLRERYPNGELDVGKAEIPSKSFLLFYVPNPN